jgi:SanA protein
MKRALYFAGGFFLVSCIAVLSVPAYLQISAAPYISADARVLPQSAVALVPGASVIGTSTLSQALRERADAALELYEAGKVQKLLVTGDNSTLEHNEVYPTGLYLASRGVPREHIFLDYAGFDTYSSMYRARDVFEAHTLVVVSQPFHLPRSVFIARALGLEAYGFEARSTQRYLYNWLREIPASVKAVLDLLLRREPKYLGERHPLAGSGASTWVLSTASSTATSTAP